jgi:hypothetical protein
MKDEIDTAKDTPTRVRTDDFLGQLCDFVPNSSLTC